MKLHLPKLLCAAVMATFTLPAFGTTYPDTLENGNVNVGVATTPNGSNIVTFEKDTLTVGDGQKVGYIEGNELIKTHNVLNGTPTEEELSANKISNTLKINGTLTITGTGQVYLGGQTGANKYTGLIADTVVVGTEEKPATGTGNKDSKDTITSGTFYNLSTTLANIGNLTVNSGAVTLRPNGGTANFKQGDWQPTDAAKITIIYDTLTVKNNGLVNMGHAKGADNTFKNSHYLNSFGRATNDGAVITQHNGTINVYGKTYCKGALEVNQYGGSMRLAMGADADINKASILRLQNDVKNTITQEGDNATTLTIGTIGSTNMAAQQTTSTLSIEQNGAGTINLTGGVLFKTKNNDSASSIIQEGGGSIYLSGDYSSALFNITQSGNGFIYLNSGAEMIVNNLAVSNESTLDIKGSMTVSGTSTLNGTVKVADSASFILNGETTVKGASSLQGNATLNGDVTFEDTAHLTVSSTITMGADSSMTFSIGSTTETDAAMQMAESGNLEFTGGSLKLELTDIAIQEMIEGATEVGTEYTLTLIDNLSDDDVAELEAAIISGSLTLEDYKWSTATTYTLRATAPDVTIESTGLLVENNALKAIVRASTQSIPEPTTATLGLLALAGLAARRRRR